MANIPSPIVVPQRRQERQNPLIQLLMSLAGSAGGAAIQSQFQPGARFGGAEQTSPVDAQDAAARAALNSIIDTDPDGSLLAIQAITAQGADSVEGLPTGAASGIIAGIKAPSETRAAEFENAAKAADRNAAIESTRAHLAGRPELQALFDFTIKAQGSGLPPSLLQPFLDAQTPPDLKDEIELDLKRIELLEKEEGLEADAFGTNFLIEKGLLPEGSPRVAGAGKMMLNIIETARGNEKDLIQDGIDYVISRVGDIAPNAELGRTLSLGTESTKQITIDDAIAEYKQIITTFLPEDVVAPILAQISSGTTMQKLTQNIAMNEVHEILLIDATIPNATIMELLADDFTPEELRRIIADARTRLARPRR